MKAAITLLGALMVLAALFALAYPLFSVTYREKVAEVPGSKLKLEEQHEQFIPPVAAGGLLLVGSALVATGIMVRRS